MAVTGQRDVFNPTLSFSLKTTITVLFVLFGLGAVATSAMAFDTVKLGSAAAKKAMSSCKEGGGVTFIKTGKNSPFGCVAADGNSGIVSGGVKASDKKTCDIFLRTPPRLPTRDEIRNAAMAEKESKEPASN